MCRLCSLYNKINLTTLPSSNPWLDEEEFQPPPTTIFVESPESARYTAWSNVRRFPSLLPLAVELDSSSTPVVSSPQEYRGVVRQNRSTWQSINRKPLPVVHELQRRRRVDSFTAVVQQERNMTPESLTPTSEHGFEFGSVPKPVELPAENRRRKSSVVSREYQYRTFNPSAVSLVPAPLRVRSNVSESQSDYINELCQDW